MADIQRYTGGIQRHDPSARFGLGDFFRDLFGDPMAETFRVDVSDDGDHYTMKADLPGLHRENIDVTAKNGYLTIQTQAEAAAQKEKEGLIIHERSSRSASRSFAIGDVDEDKITANYEDGVLTVILPKGQDAGDDPHKIQVD